MRSGNKVEGDARKKAGRTGSEAKARGTTAEEGAETVGSRCDRRRRFRETGGLQVKLRGYYGKERNHAANHAAVHSGARMGGSAHSFRKQAADGREHRAQQFEQERHQGCTIWC